MYAGDYKLPFSMSSKYVYEPGSFEQGRLMALLKYEYLCAYLSNDASRLTVGWFLCPENFGRAAAMVPVTSGDRMWFPAERYQHQTSPPVETAVARCGER